MESCNISIMTETSLVSLYRDLLSDLQHGQPLICFLFLQFCLLQTSCTWGCTTRSLRKPPARSACCRATVARPCTGQRCPLGVGTAPRLSRLLLKDVGRPPSLGDQAGAAVSSGYGFCAEAFSVLLSKYEEQDVWVDGERPEGVFPCPGQ